MLVYKNVQTLSEINQVRQLASIIWNQHYPSIISQAQIDFMLDLMYSEAKIKTELESGRVFYELIYTDTATEPIGYCSYHLKSEEQALFLSKLYILPDVHGQGYGKIALQHIEALALQHQMTSMYLFVNKANIKATRAYERFGMIQEQSIVNDIGQGFVMDDYIYRKTF